MQCFAHHCAGDALVSDAKVVASWNEAKKLKRATPSAEPHEMGAPSASGEFGLGDLPMKFWCDAEKSKTNQCLDVIKDVEFSPLDLNLQTYKDY